MHWLFSAETEKKRLLPDSSSWLNLRDGRMKLLVVLCLVALLCPFVVALSKIETTKLVTPTESVHYYITPYYWFLIFYSRGRN